MTNAEQREAARQFLIEWKDRGNEKQESQKYWIAMLSKVMGVGNATEYIDFEKTVKINGSTKYIDGYIKDTKVLIEQKGRKINLDEPERQSDNEYLTPFEQAFRYNNYLPADEKARWIIVCNFVEIRIYNMNKPTEEPQIITLENIQNEVKYLDFLVKRDIEAVNKEMDLSIQAGDIVGAIYDALRKQYHNPDSEESLKSLNALCVRLVFCMYAEDADLFGDRDKFLNYMSKIPANKWSRELRDLFLMLDTPEDKRPGYDPELEAFPYVNGGLFSDEYMEIPAFTDEIVDLIINKGCREFNWSEISPTIFGAVFESTLNPETRHSGGMHYTSIENIHKVIDSLFLKDLEDELEEIKQISADVTRKKKLNAFQDKIASLIFLDPACGSGNFLTESFLSLRRLENNILIELQKSEKKISDGQIRFADMDSDDFNPIKVSIGQFYGIEINDFAVTVARTALWIAESQMMNKTSRILYTNIDFFPLKSYVNIIEENAVTFDWDQIMPKTKLNYIMGNPPFLGARIMSSAQKEDVNLVFKGWKNAGNLDYVSCWYKKCVDYIKDTPIRCALVSTNSITQGEAVANLWKPLFEEGVHIDYAYRTFQWDSEANIKAHVHCVIIGFSMAESSKKKVIFTTEKKTLIDGTKYTEVTKSEVDNINGYLIDAKNIFIESRNKPLCDVPEIGIGNMPIDDGNYLFTKEEMEEFIKIEPASKKWFRLWYGSQEFINRKPRYCLWLGECSPAELRGMPECLKRVNAVREFRSKSSRASTKKLAESPTLFGTINMPENNYLIIPKVSSEQRRYIPIGFMDASVLSSDLVNIVRNASLYHFGVITSNVHMGWTRAVCGRLKSDYRYSKDIVYNNFPWPNPTPEQKAAIEKTAQMILDAREKYPDSSLADLYHPDGFSQAVELKKAHDANNIAVMKAYGFNIKEMSESDCVAALMKMYQELTSQ